MAGAGRGDRRERDPHRRRHPVERKIVRDAVLVLNDWGLDRRDQELLEVALADVGAQVPLVADGVACAAGAAAEECVGFDLAGGADTDLDVLQLAALRPGGVEKAEGRTADLAPDEAINS
jgi:hypothetical protein